MQYLLFLLAYPVSTHFSATAPSFNKHSYKSEAVGTLSIQPFWWTFRVKWGRKADGDCEGILDKVKTWDAALIRKMKLSEWNELFIFLIVFSCITGLLLCLMLRNRSRKSLLPTCPGYASQSTVSDWFSDVLPRKYLSEKHKFYSASISHIS